MKKMQTPHGFIIADFVADGVPINPRLPRMFYFTENDLRPSSHRKFFGVPYVVPDGDEWEVYCLDWGAHDRATWWGVFPTLAEALVCAKTGVKMAGIL